MRKKILVVAVLFGMALSLTACGEKGIQRKNDKIATVTIDGDKYVLTGDFQEVVGSMVENGTDVRHERTYEIYDEAGKYSDEILEKDNHYNSYCHRSNCMRSLQYCYQLSIHQSNH